ncbi:hypothetical protein [Bernardetia sp.]|uniref:hypothetical protein n=1 Tax=Bernardetia sp. TaxID=1937974 RepID=UPI0025BC85C5|nr:hypothetical protein [Bernardetia sp.]
MKKFVLLVLYLTFPFLLLQAQITSDIVQKTVYENHISYQKTLWRRVSLKEKQNQPFFIEENEITKLIITGVRDGKLQPYDSRDLKTEMSSEHFEENMTVPQEMPCYLTEDIGLEPETIISNDWEAEEELESEWEWFSPRQISILETKENLYFDKRRGKLISQIEVISLIIPAIENKTTGLDKTLANFSYQEVMNYLCESNFVWQDSQNRATQLQAKEAFDLMLLSGIAVEQIDKNNFGIIYHCNYIDSEHSLKEAHSYYNHLIEYESNFWEN